MLHATKRSILVAAAALAGSGLAGCYVVPVHPDGTPVHAVAVPYAAVATPAAPIVPPPAFPPLLQARLYPANEIATRTGMLAGTVSNPTAGKGRFHLDYAGEMLVGEATRVANDDRAGVANAYGPRGTYMNCEYRMSTATQGTGTCRLSTGAVYQVHISA